MTACRTSQDERAGIVNPPEFVEARLGKVRTLSMRALGWAHGEHTGNRASQYTNLEASS